VIVIGQAASARRIRTASAESPSWRRSLSSRTPADPRAPAADPRARRRLALQGPQHRPLQPHQPLTSRADSLP